MSYNDKVDAALAVVNEHNEAVGGEGKPGFVNADAFITCVKATGGTNEARLADLSHEDILACLPEHNGVKPRVLAKQVAQIFRNTSTEPVSDQKRPVSTKKAERMTPRELVEHFDPEEPENPVGKRLQDISRGEPFIVYESGRTVDVETTVKLLLEIKSGYQGREDIDVRGSTKKVYRLGELPENYADENPLYRDRPLRPDGTCDQTGRSWEGVDLSVRQLVRVAMDSGELKVNIETAHNVLDMVLEPGAMEKLRKRYRKASVQFDELAATGDLPRLRIPLGGSSESTRPFPEGRKVEWTADPTLPNAYVSNRRGGGTYTSNIRK